MNPSPPPPNGPDVRAWQRLETRPVGDFRIFTLRSDLKVSPRTGRTHDFYVIDCPNWVNVIALTRDRRMVMVEQYRHGTDTIELEVPGGVMDPGETSPVEAGLRELQEETGYTGINPRLIGRIHPNVAIMSNSCFTVFVEDCDLTHPTAFDPGEDLVTRLVPLDEIPDHIRSGRISHALVVVALHHFGLMPPTKSPGA